MKRDYAFVEFSDTRDADDARYGLNGRDVDGSRITVEFAKGVPRGPGGSREYLGRGPPPGTGRCFNCGVEGHWARDCKSGDWKNKCYRCGERGHIEKNCQNSPEKPGRGRSYSRSPSPRRGRGRARSYSRSPSISRSPPPKRDRSLERGGRRSSRSPPPKRDRSLERGERRSSRSPPKRERDRSLERGERRTRSPKRHRASPPPSRGRKHSPTPERSPREGAAVLSPRDNDKVTSPAEYSPNGRNSRRSKSRDDDGVLEDRSPAVEKIGRSPSRSRSRSFSPRAGSPIDDDRSQRGSD
ncbi:hypothetical protein ACJIZ3_022702 [Penstemon smallii]|uniref:Uncharacterized protein n=1 Tax=Penstemon smallii TaxID=265156 RepID=A0ABD3TNB8_9LAMI